MTSFLQENQNRDPVGRILISGASGMLGTAVARAFRAQEIEIKQLVRGTPKGTDEIHWDPKRRPALADPAVLEGFAGAIHLSGASVAGHRWTESAKREMVESRVETTSALANMLAALQQPPKVLVVASAIGIYGDRGDEVLTEVSSSGSGFLADLCVRWEAAAEPARAAGIRVVHTRFGVVLGKGQGALAKMLPLFRLGLGGRLGSGRQWMSWVSLEDVVASIAFALARQDLDGPINVTAPNPVRNADFTRALGEALQRPAILPAPAFALKLAFGQMADEALLSSAKAIPARLNAAGFTFKYPAIEQALAAALK